MSKADKILSKEEIEKAKEYMKFYKNHCLNRELVSIKNYKTVNDEYFIYKNIETLLQYIEQLEQGNNKQNKIIDEMLTVFVDNEEEFKCSECCYECERDRDTLYQCNKQYFEEKAGDKNVENKR